MTMMLVQSLGNILTIRLSENRAQTSPHPGEKRERKKRKGTKRDSVTGRKRENGGTAQGGLREIAAMMRMREVDSERQSEGV